MSPRRVHVNNNLFLKTKSSFTNCRWTFDSFCSLRGRHFTKWRNTSKNLKSQLIVLGWFAHRDIIGGLRLPFSDVFVGLILYWVQIKTQMQLHNVFSVPLALVDSIVCTYFPLFCIIYGLLDMQSMRVLWYLFYTLAYFLRILLFKNAHSSTLFCTFVPKLLWCHIWSFQDFQLFQLRLTYLTPYEVGLQLNRQTTGASLG